MINLNRLEIETCKNCWTKTETACQECRPKAPQWSNTDRRDRTSEGRTRRASFKLDQRTTTDIENNASAELLKWIFAAFLIITAAGLIIATAIYL